MVRRRWAVAVAAMVTACALIAGGQAWAAPATKTQGLNWPPGPIPAIQLPGDPGPPDNDPFYRAPDSLDSHQPGTVLRSRRVAVLGLTDLTSIRAYQLLYRTTDATGHPIATVTTLLLPTIPAPGRRRLVSYHTAEDSLTTRCSPSYTLRTNSGSVSPAESGEIAALLARGWDVVVPDYEGPRSEFAVGMLEGRAALDSVRAVEHFGPADLDGARTKVGMMGYSGGSIPTIWANALRHDYAPELNLVGVAAGGLVPNPRENLRMLDGTSLAGAIVGASVGINRAYPELDLHSILTERGRALARRDGRDADGCAASIVNAPFARISRLTHFPNARALLAVARVDRVLDKVNLIKGPTPRAPSFFFNEINDEIAFIKPVDELVATNCHDGATIEYRRDNRGEHGTGAVLYIEPGMRFLGERFAGRRAPNTCPERH